jgi:hypothetical protein
VASRIAAPAQGGVGGLDVPTELEPQPGLAMQREQHPAAVGVHDQRAGGQVLGVAGLEQSVGVRP